LVDPRQGLDPRPGAEAETNHRTFFGMKQIGFYPLVTYKIAIENDPVEIVDFPIKDGTLMGFN